MKQIFYTFLLIFCSACQQDKDKENTHPADPNAKVLVEEILFSWLETVNYRQNSNSPTDIVQGGEFAHEIFKLDSEKYQPLATQWVGIKSLDQIVGKPNTYYRYVVTAELYKTEAQAAQRDEGFEANNEKHIADGKLDGNSKCVIFAMHFPFGRLFYVFTTDMGDSWSQAEISRLRLSVLGALSKS